VSPTAPGESRAVRNVALTLLFASVWINYIDRGNLGVAAPVLAPALGLGPAQMGVLFSAFFWTYALFQIASGWVADRYDVNRVYATGFFLWSAATLLTGFTTTLSGLLALRMLLGMSESVAYPCYARILARYYPEHKRGFANELVDVGTKAGPALGTFAGARIMAHYGWRAMFIGMGVISFAWLVPWLLVAPRTFHWPKRTISSSPGPGFHAILTKRAAWVTFCGLFCFNYAFYFLLSWLPSYLVNERRFSLADMALYGAMPFCATAVASLAAGWFSDFLTRRGADPGIVRRNGAAAGLLVCGVALPISTTANHLIAMSMLVIAFVAIGVFTCYVWAITQRLAGPEAAGTWTGLQNAIGNMGGVVAPIATGYIVKATGSFFLAFIAASIFLLIGAAIYAFGLGRVQPVVWGKAVADSPSGGLF
jgi:MFS transporter, ACS family, D-galactonate transporter